MADRLSAYADWLVANQNKQGTPEFETVANSYKQLRSQGTTAPQAAPDDSLTTGMANSALRMAGGATDFLPTVTKAITGYENPRIQIPEDPDGLFGYGMPRFVDASDPRLEGATNPLGFEGNEFEKAADAIYAKQKSLNYQPKVPWEQVKADPSAANVLGFMGEAAVTSLPDMAAAMINAPLYFTTYVAPIAKKRAENDGRTQVTPADLSYAAAASAGIATAERFGAKGIFSKGTGNVVTRPLKAGGKEAVTESIQNPLEYAAETVNTQAGFNPNVALDQAAAGFVGGAGAGTGIRGTLDATSAVVNAVGPNDTPTDQEAAADLAERLQGIIVANNLNVKDIKKKSTKGAREAVDKAHIQIAEEMKQLRKDLKKLLNVEKLDEIDTVVDKVSAEAGARQARNKTKSTVGQQEFDATERLVGNTLEGQQLLKLYRQSNELTELHNQGYIGGLSQFTDQVSPFSSQVGYAPGSAAELPTRLLGTAAGLSLNPAYTAAQVGAVGAGRAVDALTGRRSVVRKYLQQNAGKQGVAVDPDAPSLRATAIQDDETRKAEEQALRELMLERDNPPKGDPNDPKPSPEYRMQSITGLNRQDVDKALDIIEKEVPLLKSAVKGYRKMLREGTQVPNLNFLIQEVRGTINRNPDKFPNRTAPTVTSVFTGETPGYRRGIEANRQKIENIKRDVNADPNLNQDDKEIIFDALDDMGGNLGLDPRRTATGILDAAVEVSTDKIAVADYLNDYVKRVDRQQKQSAAKAKSEERPKARIHGLPEQDDIEGFVDLRLPEEAPPKRKHREIGEELMREQRQRFGRDLDPYNDGGDFETVAAEMTKEAQFQSDKTPDAAHWYDNDIREALATTAEVLPEINETPDHRQLFLLLAALTSVGQKPKLNWRYAGSLAMHYYRSGELGEIGQIYSDKRKRFEERLVNPVTGKLLGQKAGSIEPGLYILRHMLNTRGLNETISWLNSAKTKAEIDAMRKEAGYGPQGKIKGGMKAVVPAIQMFGPKVGPFYMNLNGIHEVTVDLWASRTVRRHTGGLLADPKLEGSGLVDAPTELERPTMKDLFTRVGENLGVTPQSAQAILWAYEQELYNDLGANLIYEKFSEGAEAFRETEAVAYADRNARIASGQAGSGTNDAQEAIDLNQQFDPRRPDLGLQVAAGSRPASPEEVRDVKPTTDAMFEVGKPGSQFENGIPDLETATKLAEALGFALHIASNKNDLARVFGKASMGSAGFHTGGAKSARNPSKTVRDTLTGRDVRTSIGVLGEYKNPRNPEESVTPLEALFVALHEIGHGIEGGFIPGIKEGKEAKQRSFYNRLSDGALTDSDRLYEDTFRDAIAQLMDAASGFLPANQRPETFVGSGEAQSILNEIVRQQSQGILNESATPVRPTYSRYGQAILEAEGKGDTGRANQIAGRLQKLENEYFQTPHELAADLIGLYLLNPKKAKAEMPQATKLVRDILNKSDVVQFYSMPLAAMVAAIFANMLLAEGEEEDRKGILAQQTI